jgi:hypothetical protein
MKPLKSPNWWAPRIPSPPPPPPSDIKAPAPGPSELDKWKAKHASCPRGGPAKEARVHVYDYWLCTCGDRFKDPPA